MVEHQYLFPNPINIMDSVFRGWMDKLKGGEGGRGADGGLYTYVPYIGTEKRPLCLT